MALSAGLSPSVGDGLGTSAFTFSVEMISVGSLLNELDLSRRCFAGISVVMSMLEDDVSAFDGYDPGPVTVGVDWLIRELLLPLPASLSPKRPVGAVDGAVCAVSITGML